jgi:hypothetical protein
MSAVPGRVICSRCGANNFETQAACWKCGVSMVSGGPAPILSPNASGNPAPAAAYRPQSNVDPSVAFWSAIALAVFFGPVAIPVGLVFMMLDDRRKVDLGKLTLIAGIISTVIQLIFTFMALQAVTSQVFQMVPSLMRGTSQPGLNDEVGDGGLRFPGAGMPQTNLPSIPTGPEIPFPEPPRQR